MKYESSFKSEADGLEISVMALIPDKKPYRAVVQLVHGMSEHKERYIPFMQHLAKLGYVVVIHDHRGHGKSVLDKKAKFIKSPFLLFKQHIHLLYCSTLFSVRQGGCL